MATLARLDDRLLDDFLEMEDDEQWALVDAFLHLASLFELATSLDHRYKGAPWPLSRKITLRIRTRLDPEPFLAMTEERQLQWIDAHDMEDVLGLHNSYLDWLADGDERPLSPKVLARMLERIDEEEHSRYAQDPEVVEALTPEALTEMREASVRAVGQLLAEDEPARIEFVGSLDDCQLADLKMRLERYSHRHGRSRAWHAVYQQTTDLIKKGTP